MIYTIPLETVATDSPERKKLKRDLAIEALTRLEEAARTFEEFKRVTKWWNKRDENRERRERYYEQRIANAMFDWNFSDLVAYEEDFLNIIFSCVCEMHELTDDPDVSRVVKNATDKQKAAFFPRFLRRCTTQKIAECYDMTDRNVRKLTDKMIENAQAGLFEALRKKAEAKQPFSKRQRLFLETYEAKDEKTKIISIESHIPKPSTKKKRGRKKIAIGDNEAT